MKFISKTVFTIFTIFISLFFFRIEAHELKTKNPSDKYLIFYENSAPFFKKYSLEERKNLPNKNPLMHLSYSPKIDCETLEEAENFTKDNFKTKFYHSLDIFFKELLEYNIERNSFILLDQTETEKNMLVFSGSPSVQICFDGKVIKTIDYEVNNNFYYNAIHVRRIVKEDVQDVRFPEYHKIKPWYYRVPIYKSPSSSYSEYANNCVVDYYHYFVNPEEAKEEIIRREISRIDYAPRVSYNGESTFIRYNYKLIPVYKYHEEYPIYATLYFDLEDQPMFFTSEDDINEMKEKRIARDLRLIIREENTFIYNEKDKYEDGVFYVGREVGGKPDINILISPNDFITLKNYVDVVNFDDYSYLETKFFKTDEGQTYNTKTYTLYTYWRMRSLLNPEKTINSYIPGCFFGMYVGKAKIFKVQEPNKAAILIPDDMVSNPSGNYPLTFKYYKDENLDGNYRCPLVKIEYQEKEDSDKEVIYWHEYTSVPHVLEEFIDPYYQTFLGTYYFKKPGIYKMTVYPQVVDYPCSKNFTIITDEIKINTYDYLEKIKVGGELKSLLLGKNLVFLKPLFPNKLDYLKVFLNDKELLTDGKGYRFTSSRYEYLLTEDGEYKIYYADLNNSTQILKFNFNKSAPVGELFEIVDGEMVYNNASKLETRNPVMLSWDETLNVSASLYRNDEFLCTYEKREKISMNGNYKLVLNYQNSGSKSEFFFEIDNRDIQINLSYLKEDYLDLTYLKNGMYKTRYPVKYEVLNPHKKYIYTVTEVKETDSGKTVVEYITDKNDLSKPVCVSEKAKYTVTVRDNFQNENKVVFMIVSAKPGFSLKNLRGEEILTKEEVDSKSVFVTNEPFLVETENTVKVFINNKYKKPGESTNKEGLNEVRVVDDLELENTFYVYLRKKFLLANVIYNKINYKLTWENDETGLMVPEGGLITGDDFTCFYKKSQFLKAITITNLETSVIEKYLYRPKEDGSYTITKEGKYSVEFIDIFNNSFKYSLVLDKTKPEIKVIGLNEHFKTNKTVRIMWQELDCKGFLNGSPYRNGSEIISSGDYEFKLFDQAKNTTVINFSISSELPVYELFVDSKIDYNDTIITNKRVTLEVSKHENTYVLNEQIIKEDTVLTSEGEYILEIKNDFGNVRTVKITIDKTPPIYDVVGLNEFKHSNKLVFFTWTEENVTATLDGNSYYKGKEIISFGKHEFVLIDTAGNERKTEFWLVKTKPDIEVMSEELKLISEAFYNKPVRIKFHDEEMVDIKCFVNEEEVSESEISITTDGIKKLKLINEFNEKVEKTIDLRFKIPEITKNFDGDKTNKPAIFNWKDESTFCTDKFNNRYESGIPIVFDGEYELIFTDKYRNKEVLTFTLKQNIDNPYLVVLNSKGSPELMKLFKTQEISKAFTIKSDKLTVTVDGKPYEKGQLIEEFGSHKISATDEFGNTAIYEVILKSYINKKPAKFILNNIVLFTFLLVSLLAILIVASIKIFSYNRNPFTKKKYSYIEIIKNRIKYLRKR